MGSLCARLRCRAAAPVAVAVVAVLGAAPASASVVASWGDNSGGELGDGTLAQSASPVAVAGLAGATQIAAGYRFSLALVPGGHVRAWGENQFGQLGDGTTTDRALPVSAKGLSGVVALAAGGGHALALRSDGTVLAWGDNAFGQLGDGTTTSRSTPASVPGLTGVRAIAAGFADSVAVLSDGTVVDWGDNRDGQLGDGTSDPSDVPVTVPGLHGVASVASGGFFNLALLRDGTVRAWGDDLSGQLGDGGGGGGGAPVRVHGLSGVSAISAGDAHALALLTSGAVRAWGDNSFNQLGVPSAGTESDVPVAVGGLSGVRAVAAGGLSSAALRSTGSLEAWGDNALGQLGNGTTDDAAVPQAVPGPSGVTAVADGADHMLALEAAGTGPPAGSAAPTPWRVAPTPNPGDAPFPATVTALFTAVSAAGAGDAWAVGQSGFIDSQPMAEHWDGHSWTVVAVPSPGGESVLGGVVDVAPGNAWAVGTQTLRSTGNQRTLIEHWDGHAWSIVPSPNPIGGSAGNDALQAIAGTSAHDLWAVGQDFRNAAGAHIALLFEHYDGTSWTAVPSPPPVGDDFAAGIATISPTDAWAVGTNAFLKTLAAHWNGRRWSIVHTPSLADGSFPTNALTGVSAVASGDVWASGYEDNVDGANFRKPYLEHWDGAAWKLVPAPNAGTEGSRLNGIAALGPDDVWAVGQTQENDGSILTLTERFDGSRWTPVPSPSPGQLGPIVSSSLDAAASPGGGALWAVGAQETLGLCCTRTLALEATGL